MTSIAVACGASDHSLVGGAPECIASVRWGGGASHQVSPRPWIALFLAVAWDRWGGDNETDWACTAAMSDWSCLRPSSIWRGEVLSQVLPTPNWSGQYVAVLMEAGSCRSLASSDSFLVRHGIAGQHPLRHALQQAPIVTVNVGDAEGPCVEFNQALNKPKISKVTGGTLSTNSTCHSLIVTVIGGGGLDWLAIVPATGNDGYDYFRRLESWHIAEPYSLGRNPASVVQLNLTTPILSGVFVVLLLERRTKHIKVQSEPLYLDGATMFRMHPNPDTPDEEWTFSTVTGISLARRGVLPQPRVRVGFPATCTRPWPLLDASSTATCADLTVQVQGLRPKGERASDVVGLVPWHAVGSILFHCFHTGTDLSALLENVLEKGSYYKLVSTITASFAWRGIVTLDDMSLLVPLFYSKQRRETDPSASPWRSLTRKSYRGVECNETASCTLAYPMPGVGTWSAVLVTMRFGTPWEIVSLGDTFTVWGGAEQACGLAAPLPTDGLNGEVPGQYDGRVPPAPPLLPAPDVPRVLPAPAGVPNQGFPLRLALPLLLGVLASSMFLAYSRWTRQAVSPRFMPYIDCVSSTSKSSSPDETGTSPSTAEMGGGGEHAASEVMQCNVNPGQVFASNKHSPVLHEIVGRGGSCQVFRATWYHTAVAVKVMHHSSTSNAASGLLREAMCLK